MLSNRTITNRAPTAMGVLLVVFLLAAHPGFPQSEEALESTSVEVIDRVLAIVDDDPILLSEIERRIELGLVTPEEGEPDQIFRRRVLDGLIEQRLRLHELDRYGGSEVAEEEVEHQVESLQESLGGPGALESRLSSMNMTEQDLRNLFQRQIQVLRFIEERLGPRVFVDVDDIRDYYDRVLVPQLEQRQDPDSPTSLPELSEVREQIREVLTQQRLNEEIADWTFELRRAADVLDFFDQDPTQLPPVVD